MKTFSPRPRDIERRWFVVDANGAVLGRLASEVAKVLRGKHKPIFAPHMDTGDNVIVVNARGIRVTGGKESEKRYYRHSGYPGGIRGVEYTRLLAERPALAVEKAIKGMLPKNRLGRQMFTKLAVYEGPDHPHQAQKPVRLGLGEIPKWEGLPEPKPAKAPPARPKRATVAKAEEKGRGAKAAVAAGGTRSARATAKSAGATSARGRKTAPPAANARAKEGTAKRRTRASAPSGVNGERKKAGGTPRRPRAKKES